MSPPSSPHNPAAAIAALAFGGFLAVTTEFVILGLLPQIAGSLRVSVVAVGQLVTVFALTVAVLGPPLTLWLGRIERRALFTALMLVLAASNVLAALAPTFALLVPARILPALALPVFWGMASDTAATMAGPARSGRAIGRVYLGISAALVLGVPLGTVAGAAIGWRGAFAALAVLCLVAAIVLRLLLPVLPQDGARPPRPAILLRDRAFLGEAALSVLVFTAMFTAYTYLAEILRAVADVPESRIGWWLMWFGGVGLLGNHLGGILADRLPRGATSGAVIVLALAMIAVVPSSGSLLALLAVVAVWGAAYTALFPIRQVVLVRIGAAAPALAGTINVSAANAGAALGAVLGGLVISHSTVAWLGPVAAFVALFAALAAFHPIFARKNDRKEPSNR